eukprot:CAMPEP_0196143020 /NCGR_PEP_ID=MMETSP0910-20130528/12570_1 /TAXON_ID=49265 /ORGANISM="Thalassiosira rotula, Strain GSO102" /LENGTH=71 /DNA_ID=CAMNT_0041404405 /DNA_START=381 /DNA_END=596 /DNA_ORIENTATION=+
MASSDAFCSSALGIDKSSTESSARATEGENAMAAIDANEVFKKSDLSRGDDASPLLCALSATRSRPVVAHV